MRAHVDPCSVIDLICHLCEVRWGEFGLYGDQAQGIHIHVIASKGLNGERALLCERRRVTNPG